MRKDKRPNGVVSSDDLQSNRSLLRELHPKSHPFQMERLEMIAERDDRLSSHAKEQCRRRGKCAQSRCSVQRARCTRATSPGSHSGARNNNRVCTRGRERAPVLVATHNGARLMLTTPFSEYGYQLPLTSGAHEFSYASGNPASELAMKPAEAATIAFFSLQRLRLARANAPKNAFRQRTG